MKHGQRPHAVNVVGALSIALFDAQMESLSGFDRPQSDLLALLAVQERPGIPVGHIASTLDLTHSGAVRTIDRLVDQNLVVRRRGADKRASALYPTAQGKRLAKKILAARQGALEGLLGYLTKDELGVLTEISDRVLRARPLKQERVWRVCRLCAHHVCRGESCPAGSAVSE